LVGHPVLGLEASLDLLVFFIVLLVLLEHLGVLSQVLFVRGPRSVECALLVAWVLQVMVYSPDVIVVDSVLYVLEVVVGYRHAYFHQLVRHLLLGVLELVEQCGVFLVDLLSECKFSHFVVDHGQLLHFLVVFSDQVLLLLTQVAQVPGGRSSVNLTRRNRSIRRHVGSSGHDGKALDDAAFSDGCSHADVGKAFEDTVIKSGVGSDVNIIFDVHRSIRLRVGSNPAVVLDHRVATDSDFRKVTSEFDAVPDRGPFLHSHVSNENCVGGNPVRREGIRVLSASRGNAPEGRLGSVLVSHGSLESHAFVVDLPSEISNFGSERPSGIFKLVVQSSFDQHFIRVNIY